MIKALVTCNGRDAFPALIDPAAAEEGFVNPWFDLDTARSIAAVTQADAARAGHGSTAGTAHVLTGEVDGAAQAIVMTVCWIYLAGEQREDAVEIVEPNEAGLYAIGGFDWCWYTVDEAMNSLVPHQLRRRPRPPFPQQHGN